MRKLHWTNLTMTSALLAFLAIPLAYAQRGPGAGPRARLYNPANETTVKGVVMEVKTITGRRGWNGTHLTLKAEGKSVDVHLGPAAFLKEKGFSFTKGDQIEVTGAKTQNGNSEAIIAREVKKDGKTLVLRNAQGVPEWAGGWRR